MTTTKPTTAQLIRAVAALRDDEFLTVEEITATLIEEGVRCEDIAAAIRGARRYPADRPCEWNA